jgi:hypothetical protein
MKIVRTRLSSCILSVVLMGAVTIPGCQQVAVLFYELMLTVGLEVARPMIVRLINEWIDSLELDSDIAASRNARIVSNSDNALVGNCSGPIALTVDDVATSRKTRRVLDSPNVSRSDPSSTAWRLDPAVREKAKMRFREAVAGP